MTRDQALKVIDGKWEKMQDVQEAVETIVRHEREYKQIASAYAAEIGRLLNILRQIKEAMKESPV